MHISQIGQGPPVIFLHGCPTPPEILLPIGQALAAHRTSLLVHAPGYGQSPVLPPSPQGLTLTAVQAEIERELIGRGITEAALVGYSLGAYQALALALRGNIKATRIVCLGGLANLPQADRDARVGAAALIRSGVDLKTMLVQRMVSPGFAERYPEEAQQVSEWPNATSVENLVQEIEATARCENLLPALSALSVPVLLRVGELDLATPPERSREIATAAHTCTLEIVPSVGHALLLEDLEGTIASVKRFLLSSG